MKRVVYRDRDEKIMWIKGRTDISPLTWREMREGADMPAGASITKNGVTYFAPFTIGTEDIK